MLVFANMAYVYRHIYFLSMKSNEKLQIEGYNRITLRFLNDKRIYNNNWKQIG